MSGPSQGSRRGYSYSWGLVGTRGNSGDPGNRNIQYAVMRALAFGARHERHRHVPVASWHQSQNGFATGFAETRTTQQNKNHSKETTIDVQDFQITEGTPGAR